MPRGRARQSAARDQEPLPRAKALALRLLAIRARTEAQIRARLAREELSEQAEEVLAWLRTLRYLDDGAYARAQARSLLVPGKLGPLKVERRLVQAGLDPTVARAAVREALAGEAGTPPAAAERELCRTLAERRAREPLDQLDDRARARLARFLAGRGFGGSVISAVLGIHVDVES
jgi:regulatory protein